MCVCVWMCVCLCVQGVVYEGREDLTPDNYLSEVAVPTHKRTLQEAVEGADVFLGLSVSVSIRPPTLSHVNLQTWWLYGRPSPDTMC